ncbi:hypothetical protein I3842_04G055900, partial [Carya illinoinensis]
QTSVYSSSSGSLDLDAIENILNGVSPEYENAGLEMQGPTSAAADHASDTPLLSNQNVLSTQFAQTQLMGTPAGYDPNRIPSSIFSNIPTTPMDWSTASNESLFSIQIENSSFSRDNFIMLNKSGELPRLDELITIPPIVPRALESGEDKSDQSADHSGRNSEVTEASSQTSTVAWWTSPEYDDDMGKVLSLAMQMRNSNAMSYRSDESNHSAHSFNFPLLTGSSGLSSPVTMDLKRQQLQQQSQPQNKRMASKRVWVKLFNCLSFRSQCF